MSFKDYIKESKNVMDLINAIQDINEHLLIANNKLEELKQISSDKELTAKLGNIDLQNSYNQVELAMSNVYDKLKKFQDSITGGSTVSNTTGGSNVFPDGGAN